MPFARRLHLLELGAFPSSGAPVPGYLIVAGDGRTLLVDTGLARPTDREAARRGARAEGIGPEDVDYLVAEDGTDRLVAALAEVGVRPADVDVLVCTHLDRDHCGNHALFAHATWYIQRRHHRFALASSAPRIVHTRDAWDRPDAKWRLLDGDAPIAPGVTAIVTDGHVPGHQSVLVQLAESGRVLLAADAVTGRGEWTRDRRPGPFDLDPDAARRSARKLLSLEPDLVVFGHDGAQWPSLRRGADPYR